MFEPQEEKGLSPSIYRVDARKDYLGLGPSIYCQDAKMSTSMFPVVPDLGQLFFFEDRLAETSFGYSCTGSVSEAVAPDEKHVFVVRVE